MLLVEGNSPKVTPTPVISETSWCWEIGLWGCWGGLCVVEGFVRWCVHLQMTKMYLHSICMLWNMHDCSCQALVTHQIPTDYMESIGIVLLVYAWVD